VRPVHLGRKPQSPGGGDLDAGILTICVRGRAVLRSAARYERA